jgi:hypothetical protein
MTRMFDEVAANASAVKSLIGSNSNLRHGMVKLIPTLLYSRRKSVTANAYVCAWKTLEKVIGED